MGRATGMGCAILLGLGLGAAAAGDVLELRNGAQLTGSFRGADEHSIEFETAERVHLIPLADARSLTFGEVGSQTSAEGSTAPPALPPAQARRAAPSERARAATPRPARAHPRQATKPASPAPKARSAPASRTPGRTAAKPTPGGPAARPTASPAKSLEIPVGTLLRVRITDTVDPRIGAAGDRFAGLLQTELSAGGSTVIPARSRVYGIVSEARTQGPVASRLKLELTELMRDGEMIRLVTGTHKLVGAGEAAPAKAAGARPDRLPAGSLLEFRLLQAVELR